MTWRFRHMYGAHDLGHTSAEIEAVMLFMSSVLVDLIVTLPWLTRLDTDFLTIPCEKRE